jgi:uncharacterized membrane protein (UPF0136 family)
MKPEIVLWGYIVLLLVGGVMGLVKGKSKISLIASVVFAIPLALCALQIIKEPRVADGLLLFLFIFFGLRFIKSKKFMPGGMMALASVAAVVLRHI